MIYDSDEQYDNGFPYDFAGPITIEGRCFTERVPGINMDSSRVFDLRLTSGGDFNYDITETDVSNG